MRMRVGVLSENLYACGASIAALRSADLLVNAGYDVSFIHEKSQNLDAVRAQYPAVEFIHRKEEFLVEYERAARSGRYDTFILNNFIHETHTAMRLCDHVPVLWKLHDASAFSGFNYAMRAADGASVLWYSRRKGLPRRADFEALGRRPFMFAAPSRWMQRLAQAYVGEFIDVALIRNAVPRRHFFPRDKAAARAALGLPEDGFLVLFFAGVGAAARKNLGAALAATRRLDRGVRMVAVGGAPREEVAGAGDVLFLPGVSPQTDPLRPGQLMAAADVLLLTSLVDNFPNTVLEAQACGTPVVAADAGGVGEMLLDGETGWLVDARDVGALAERLNALAAAPRTVADAGDRAARFVAEAFSEEATLAQYQAAIDHVTSRRDWAAKKLYTDPLHARRARGDPLTLTHGAPFYEFRKPRGSRLAAIARNRPLRGDSHIAPYRKTWSPSPAEVDLLGFRYRMAAEGWPLTENERRINSWCNAYRGRRAFLIGNGPSLNKCDLSLLRDEITIGVNSIFFKADELGGLPTHFVVEDNFVAEDRAKEINALKGTQKWFGNYLNYCLSGDDVNWLNVRMRYDQYYGFPYFSYDAGRQVWTGGSVTYVCMQLAFYFGVRELILIGFDHHYVVPKETEIEGLAYTSQVDDPNHFDPQYFGKGYRWHAPMTERMEMGYRRAKQAYERFGRRIVNATVGGRLEVYDRVDYRSLFDLRQTMKA